MSKVFVMMSGGVDSSVAAADLVDQGHEVIGVFMKCWSIEQLESLGADKSLYGCFWEDDVTDARLVAAKLKIPFYVWDFQAEYKAGVVDYMLFEYQNGRTPNPDVMCNSIVKFGIFYQRAMELGADFVATGHYAKIAQFSDFLEPLTESEIVGNTLNSELWTKSQKYIVRGRDSGKDQSYFLWRVKSAQIQKSLFPIGEYQSKAEVRVRAESLGLITASKPDSQGLCFIGETPLRELLLQTLGQKNGEILDESGRVLGVHPGAFLFTIGQRSGLGLSGGPWFVVSLDMAQNQVIVARAGQDESLLGTKLLAKELNWQISAAQNLTKFSCQTQIRYRQDAVDCTVEILENGNIEVGFTEPIRAISPGQSIVLYHGEIMLGGGVIQSKI